MAVNDTPAKAFLDTGSCVSLIKNSVLGNLIIKNTRIRPCKFKLATVDGRPLHPLGSVSLDVTLGTRVLTHKFIICEADAYPGDTLFGSDLLKRIGTIALNLEQERVTLVDTTYHFTKTDTPSLSVSVVRESNSPAYTEEEYVAEQPCCEPPNLDHLPECHQRSVQEILDKFENNVSKNPEDIGFCELTSHRIHTGDHFPIATRQWPLPHSTKETMKKQCGKMQAMDVVEKCYSGWNSPVLLVRKSDGTFRFCVDFRKINEISTKDRYPLPLIDTVLKSLKGATCFTTLDLRSGYWQIPVHEDDRDKTAFTIDGETYRFKRLPFGLHNAPATFQRLMNQVLAPVLGKSALVYLDDIIIYSKNANEHLEHLNNVLELISTAGLKISPGKCEFLKNELKYLGHVVSHEGIKVDPDKVTAIREMKPPNTVRGVRGFMGMASYYRKFVPNFSALAAPLTELTKKNKRFVWTEKHQEAFQVLKDKLMMAPVLQYPDYEKTFRIHCDSSDRALGAMLCQQQDGVDMPIAFYSRKFSPAETRYSTTEKEALAIVDSVKHFSPHVFGYHFQVLTDHAPLRYLFNYKPTVPRITRWALFLSEYDYEIIYKPGREHVVPDQLSRPVNAIQVASGPQDDQYNPADVFDPETMRSAQLAEPQLERLIRALEGATDTQVTPEEMERHTLHERCLYLAQTGEVGEDTEGEVQIRLMIPESHKKQALLLSHDSTIGGHYGFKKTWHRAKKMFFWPNMMADVRQHVSNCITCQKRNHHGTLQAKIQNFPSVTQPMERVGVDLIGKISPSWKGYQYVLTIVCHFSRYVQAYPLRDKRAETVADAFLDYICRYGCPSHVVADRGSEFTSAIFKEVNALMNAKLHFTTAFHPQSNGMTESFNKLLKNTLFALVENDVKSWDDQLPCAVLALNCSYHPAIRQTPYYLFHGRHPPLQYSRLLNSATLDYSLTDESPKSRIARLKKAFSRALEASDDAHELNCRYKKVKMYPFAEGDVVFLRNDATRRGPHSKFRANWIGPFLINQKLTEVNFEIEPLYCHGQKKVVHMNRLKIARLSEDSPYLPVTEVQEEGMEPPRELRNTTMETNLRVRKEPVETRNRRTEDSGVSDSEDDEDDDDEQLLAALRGQLRRRYRPDERVNDSTAPEEPRVQPTPDTTSIREGQEDRPTSSPRYALRSRGPI